MSLTVNLASQLEHTTSLCGGAIPINGGNPENGGNGPNGGSCPNGGN